MSSTLERWFASLCVAVAVSACATDVLRTPAALDPAPSSDRASFHVAEEASVRSTSGYRRVIAPGSGWTLRGRIAQGAVYARRDGVFTIEGAHVHEAFLVLDGNRLVGFYLPVERAFSPADPVVLKLE
jgi:hypothetical protein